MSVIIGSHLQHNTELLKLAQDHLWVRGFASTCSADRRHRPGILCSRCCDVRKDLHIGTAIHDQRICFEKIQVIVIQTRQRSAAVTIPNVRSNERIDLADGVQIAVVQTVSDYVAILLGLGVMFEHHSFLAHFRKSHYSGIMQGFASVTIRTVKIVPQDNIIRTEHII